MLIFRVSKIWIPAFLKAPPTSFLASSALSLGDAGFQPAQAAGGSWYSRGQALPA
jgi:hypothetical protein